MKRNYSRNEKKAQRIETRKKEVLTVSPERESSGKEGKWNLDHAEQAKKKTKKEERMGCCSLFVRIEDVDEFCYKTDKIAFGVFAIAFFAYTLVYIIVYTT